MYIYAYEYIYIYIYIFSLFTNSICKPLHTCATKIGFASSNADTDGKLHLLI